MRLRMWLRPGSNCSAFVGSLFLLALSARVSNVHALTLPSQGFVLDPAEVLADSLPPGVPEAVVWRIGRGRPTPEAAQWDACGSWRFQLGRITFQVSPPEDDRTRDLDLGYLFELVSGELPEGLVLPTMPVRSYWRRWPVMQGYESFCSPVQLEWHDGVEFRQDSFRFEVRMAAVDRGGNVGGYSEPIRVVHDGHVAPSAGKPGVDVLGMGEIHELRGTEWGTYKDGGSLRLELDCSSGHTYRLFVDNRMDARVRGRIYLGSGPDGIPVRKGTPAEREIVAVLRSWIDRNFVRDDSGEIVGIAVHSTDQSPTVLEGQALERGMDLR